MRKRWAFAAASFGVGLLYTTVLWLLGVEIRVGGRDVSVPIALATEIVFSVFGFLLGSAAEQRSSDRKLAAFRRHQF